MSGVAGEVPAAWPRLIAAFRAAQVARTTMRNPASPRAFRDEATARYTRAVDGMVDEMETLSGDRTLGRITLLLSKKERS